MTQEAVSFLGAGDLYMDRLEEDGSRNGLLKVGAALFSLQSNAEIKQQTAKGRTNYGQVIASATVGQPPVINISLTELNRSALAMNFLGNLSDIDEDAGSIAAEAVTVENLDRYFRLANRNIDEDSVVVTRQDGDEAPDWVAETAYEAGDFVVPATPNQHFYMCTVAGTSGASAPTFPTDGTTVVDGTATWKDMGTVVAVVDVDYDLIARTGMLRALSTGEITAGEVLSVAYDKLALTGAKILGAVQPTIKSYLFLDGINKVNGKDVEVEVWEAQIRPTSPVDFLADDFTTHQMEGTPVTPSDKSSPFEIKYYD